MTQPDGDPGIDLLARAMAEQFWPNPNPNPNPQAEAADAAGAVLLVDADPHVAESAPASVAESVDSVADTGSRLERPPSRRRIMTEWAAILLVAALIAIGLKTIVLQSYSIPSESMVPTLLVGDRVLVNKLAYEAHDVRRGDVVVLDRPAKLPASVQADSEPDQLIKRVIGLPGETIEARGGVVLINGRALVEPYLAKGADTDRLDEPVKIPPGCVFLMGDNRNFSLDSRVFGVVRVSTIVGRAVARVWPPNRVGFL